jgi:tetratricopeptide (TPR) repeat protein
MFGDMAAYPAQMIGIQNNASAVHNLYNSIQALVQGIPSILFYLIEITSLFLILLVIMSVYAWLWSKVETITIFSFENTTGDQRFDGKAVADSLIAELERIRNIYGKEFKIRESEILPLPPETPSRQLVDRSFGEIMRDSHSFAASLKNLGTVSTGKFNIPLGELLLNLDKLPGIARFFHHGNSGITISGSVQEFDSTIRLVSFIGNKGHIQGIESCENSSNEGLSRSIREMAYRITYNLLIQGKQTGCPYKGIHNISKGDLKITKVEDKVIEKDFKNKLGITDEELNRLVKYSNELEEKYSIFLKTSPQKKIGNFCPRLSEWATYKVNNEDIINKEDFMAELFDYGDLSLYIQRKWLDAKKSEKGCNEAGYFERSMRANLIQEINGLLEGVNLYDEKFLRTKSLSKNTRELLQKCPSDIKEICPLLNRLLLEDVYPKYIKKIDPNNISWKANIGLSLDGFMHATEAWASYNRYNQTEDEKDLKQAKEECEFVLKLDKQCNHIFGLIYNIGLAFIDTNKLDDAAIMFRYAVEMEPTSAGAFCGLAACLRHERKFGEALDNTIIAISLDNSLPLPWVIFAGIYFDLACYAEDLNNIALAACFSAIKRDSITLGTESELLFRFSYPWIYIGGILYRNYHSRKKREDIEMAIKALEISRKLPGYQKYVEFATPVVLSACYKTWHKEFSNNFETNRFDNYEITRLDILRRGLSKTGYNRACFEAIQENYDLAIKMLRDELEGKRTSLVEILFDPDFNEMKNDDKFKHLFKIYHEDESMLRSIGVILEKENPYIRASFYSISGNINNVFDEKLYKIKNFDNIINNLKKALENETENDSRRALKNRIENDRHFKFLFKNPIFREKIDKL